MVSGRGCSSLSVSGAPVTGSTTMKSERPKRFSSMAVAAFRWLSSAKRSTSSRLNPSSVAMRSAEMPCGTICTFLRRTSLSPSIMAPSEPIGTRDIDSTPPPTVHSCAPLAIPIAAKFTACSPEPQNRFTVLPVTSSGQPAAMIALRAMHAPCSLTWVTQPMVTSSTRLLSSPALSAIRLSVWARSSCG